MPVQETEPLDPATWFSQVGRLASATQGLDGEAPDSLIRRAIYLAELSPGPLRDLFSLPIDHEAVERLLDCGGYEAAVMALIKPKTAFSAERSATSDTIRVSVQIDPGVTAGQGNHVSLAKAMLQALVDHLTQFGKAKTPITSPDQDPHRLQNGWRQRLTEH